MSTQSTTNNSRTGEESATAKGNYNAVQWSNNFGAISLGKVHKKGDVISSIMMQAVDGRHKFYMDSDGQRPGYTQLLAPGAVAIRCGPDLDAEQDAIILAADNGDIDIIASNGKIRMVADDIEFVATGGLDQGNIKLTASESIIMNAKKINGTGKNLVRFSTPNTLEMVANGQCKFVAAVIRAATDACSIKDDKYGHKRKHDENFTVN